MYRENLDCVCVCYNVKMWFNLTVIRRNSVFSKFEQVLFSFVVSKSIDLLADGSFTLQPLRPGLKSIGCDGRIGYFSRPTRGDL